MILPGQPVPDLLPLEPPEENWWLRQEPDEDRVYQQWKDEHELSVGLRR